MAGVSNFSVDLMDIEIPDMTTDVMHNLDDNFFGDYLQAIEERLGEQSDDQLPLPIDGSLPLPPSFDLDALVRDATADMHPPTHSTALTIKSESSAGSQPSVPPTSLPSAHSGTHMASHGHDGTASADYLDPLSHPLQKDTDEVSHAAPGRRSSGTRKVTPQRKQNNRLAQQRYREKRKAQAQETEQKLIAVTNQLEAMQGLKDTAEKLSTENSSLKFLLQQQKDEIEKLKVELTQQQHHALESADTNATGEELPSQERPLPSMKFDVATGRLKKIVETLQSILESFGLPSNQIIEGDRRYEDSRLIADLRKLLDEADRASIAVMLSAPACPYEKSQLNKTTAQLAHPCPVFRKHWTQVLNSVAMNAQQCDTLLNARQQLLDNLRGIYEERSRLNNMTMGLIIPRPNPEHNYDGTTDSKLACMEQYGGQCALRHTSELNKVLDSLKLNLRAEQTLMMKMHELLLKKILSPVQAAVLLIASEARPIEPLHVSNLVAYQRGLVKVRSLPKFLGTQSSESDSLSSGADAPIAAAVLST